MDPEIGWERAQKPRPDEVAGPPTPQGYSLSILLQLRMIDILKEQMRAYAAGLSGKLPPPFKPEPRPMTMEDIFRDRIETANVYEALANLGVTN
ncbi:hypothetical protein [Nocardia sp. NPDC049707]|uniref:hypothetical protein n=1 Tax=Nocardia sp. NPDC049707 TaxID=3154735 RepID=UPI003433CD58